MTTEYIKLPSSLAFQNCLAFANQLHALPIADRYEFDFGNMGWFPPFSMAYLAAQINSFRATRENATYAASNYKHHTYAAHMGFYQAFSLDFGNMVGEVVGSDTYIPLTEINKSELLNSNEPIGKSIDDQSKRLAEVLTRENKSELYKTLQYSLREILRNSLEHGECEKVMLCAQYWPTKGLVEVGVTDAGVGIRTALSKNPFLNIEDDLGAIQHSVLPAISGVAYEGSTTNLNNEWRNSGYGLFMTSNIFKNFGSFFIASGDAAVLLEGSNAVQFQQQFSGTAIRMTLRVKDIPSLDSFIRKLQKEGKELSENLDGIQSHGPSPASISISF